MKKFFRKLHRWLGLLMALQIIAWMASGLYFSIFPIAEIRGGHLTHPATEPSREMLAELGDPSSIGEALDEHLGTEWSLTGLELTTVGREARWRVQGRSGGKAFTRLIGPGGRGVVPRLTEEQAREKAGEWLVADGQPDSVTWLESPAAGSEYRGSILPVWKAAWSGSENVNLYLDPWTGELLARRTDRWRVFDFLWMLHIMDFDSRDDFNHPLLQIAALLGLIVSLGGVILWALTTPLFRRKKRISA